MRAASRLAWLAGCSIIAAAAGLALLGPALAPFDPRLPAGPPLLGPSAYHLLGTNDVGQDLFSEWLWAARGSLSIAAGVVGLALGLSCLVGLASGLSLAWERPLMTVTDLLLAIPTLPLYLLIVGWAGPSRASVVLTLGLLSWPALARVIRARVVQEQAQTYLEAARALGAGPARVALRHIVPAVAELLPAGALLVLRLALFGEATLAFLGLGDPSVKSWGAMLGWAFNYPLLLSHPGWGWWVAPPALSIALLILAATWLAEGVDGGLRAGSLTAFIFRLWPRGDEFTELGAPCEKERRRHASGIQTERRSLGGTASGLGRP